MAELTLHAIVLRRRDAGDSDRRLTVLTLEAGKLDVVAKGAKKSGSRLAGISDPLTMSVLGVATGRRVGYITQAQPVSAFRGLRLDYDRLRFGVAMCELFAAICPYDQPVPELYDLLQSTLEAIESHDRPLVAFAWAQIAALRESGFLPGFERCVSTGLPIEDAEPWLSAHAGGYVHESSSNQYTDRYRVKAEVLYGVTRTAALASPPANLRFAAETIQALLPFWREIASGPLPANEALTQELCSS